MLDNVENNAPSLPIVNTEDNETVKAPEDAVNTLSAPAKSILSPLNVATPEDALTVVVPLKTPVPVDIESTMFALELVTVFPNLSCTVTTGC